MRSECDWIFNDYVIADLLQRIYQSKNFENDQYLKQFMTNTKGLNFYWATLYEWTKALEMMVTKYTTTP